MAVFAADQQSRFQALLLRVGGEEELRLLMEPALQKYRVLKSIKEMSKGGYGHIAEGIVWIFGNDVERPADGFIAGRATSPAVSKGFVDECVAYRAINLGPAPFSADLVASFSQFAAVDEDFATFQELFHGGTADGSWIRPTDDTLVFQQIYQERGHIMNSSTISKADFIRIIVDSLLDFVSRRPTRRQYVETTVLCKDHPDYSPHFKALQMGLPRPLVEAKMRRVLNLNVAFLDTPDHPIVIRKVAEGDQVYISSDLSFEYIID